MWRFNPFTSTIDYYEPAGSVEAHDLGGGDHIADTLENLNSKVSDGTLIDTGDARLSDERDPTAHGSEHTDGTDDIQSATTEQKGLATSTQITLLESLDAEYQSISDWLDNVTLGDNGLTSIPEIVLVPRATALSDVQGGMYYSSVDDSVYVCTSAV